LKIPFNPGEVAIDVALNQVSIVNWVNPFPRGGMVTLSLAPSKESALFWLCNPVENRNRKANVEAHLIIFSVDRQ
jgi:hypothetical protein